MALNIPLTMTINAQSEYKYKSTAQLDKTDLMRMILNQTERGSKPLIFRSIGNY